MSAATATVNSWDFNPGDIKGLASKRTPADPLSLREFATNLNTLTEGVRIHWFELPEDLKDTLKALAYDYVYVFEGAKDRSVTARLRGFRNRVGLGILLVRGEVDALHAYLQAADSFVAAVLEQVERDDHRFQDDVSTAIKDAIEKPGRRVSVSEFNEWLSQV